MNDRQYAAQKRRIERLGDRWINALGLTHWEITIEVSRGGLSQEDTYAGTDRVARTSTDWRYMHATIEFDMPRCAGLDDDKLEMFFVHELVHVILHELRWDPVEVDGETTIPHEERVATQLAYALTNVRALGG